MTQDPKVAALPTLMLGPKSHARDWLTFGAMDQQPNIEAAISSHPWWKGYPVGSNRFVTKHFSSTNESTAPFSITDPLDSTSRWLLERCAPPSMAAPNSEPSSIAALQNVSERAGRLGDLSKNFLLWIGDMIRTYPTPSAESRPEDVQLALQLLSGLASKRADFMGDELSSPVRSSRSIRVKLKFSGRRKPLEDDNPYE